MLSLSLLLLLLLLFIKKQGNVVPVKGRRKGIVFV
jgi:hypothetical protein